MTQLQTMYPGVANSPDTFLVEGMTIDGTIMYVADAAVLGEIPTLAVIGQAEPAETVLVTGKRPDGGLAIKRGVEGKQQAWAKATNVARNWTNKDYEALRANITAINTEMGAKVDKIAGKGLSTNDYDATAKAKVDAIPPDPKYTDTVPDLKPYAKMTDLAEEYNARKSDIARLENKQIAATQSAREANAADIQSVRADYAKDIKTTKDALAVDINGARTAHNADIKRLESQKLNKADVVNDLTTGGVDKALSAEQGKVLFTYADNGKKSIADAIVGKGVDATKSDSFGVLADKISKIKTGYGVGDEISNKKVEEVKTFHQYENESDFTFKQVELRDDHDDTVDYGEPTALAVNDESRPYVGTSTGKFFSFDKFVSFNFVDLDTVPLTAISTRSNGEVYTAYDGYEDVYLSATGVTHVQGDCHYRFWTTYVGDGLISAMAAKYSYLYCGVGNKVVEINNGFSKTWEFTGHTAQVNAVAVDNDWNVYSGGADNKVFKISGKGEKIWEFTLHTAAVNALAVDNDGYVYSGGADCKVYKISPDGKKVWEDKTNNEITAIAIAPDGSILCGTTGSTLYTFQPDTTPPKTSELTYKNDDGTVIPDGDVVDIVVANNGSIFYVTKKAKVITKMKYGYYTTSYKIIK